MIHVLDVGITSHEYEAIRLESLLGNSLALTRVPPVDVRRVRRCRQRLAKPMGSARFCSVLGLFWGLVARGERVRAVAPGDVELSAVSSLPVLRVTTFTPMSLSG